MYYITGQKIFKEKQITIDDILFNFENKDLYKEGRTAYPGQTVTRRYEHIPANIQEKFRTYAAITKLGSFNVEHSKLFEVEPKQLYRTFMIPKKTGGLRRIDAPCDDLYAALSELKEILESFGASNHTAAYAYVKGRSTINAVMMHQSNESKWFLKTDLSNFFGSTTLDFIMNQLKMIFPFNMICEAKIVDEDGTCCINGYNVLRKAISLGILNGGLPQGTPLSPMLTNLIFIPLDFELMNRFSKMNMVYTRYADDMLISAKANFPKDKAVAVIREVLKEFNSPYVLKDEKTRYGSSSGKNWNLGLMLNKDNNITVGYRNKKTFKAILASFAMDWKHDVRWDYSDITHMLGLLSYYRMVEADYFDNLVKAYNTKFGMDIVGVANKLIKNEL